MPTTKHEQGRIRKNLRRKANEKKIWEGKVCQASLGANVWNRLKTKV